MSKALSRHVVYKDGIITDLMKIDAIRDWDRPTLATKVLRFFILLGYYRIFFVWFLYY